MELNLNIDDLTIEDVVDLEEKSGLTASELFGPDGDEKPRGRALQALVWICVRRDDPSFTFEDAGKMKFAELQSGVTIVEDDPSDPSEGDSETS